MIDESDLEYLRNINTTPGPKAGRSIDPTKPGPGADAGEMVRLLKENNLLIERLVEENALMRDMLRQYVAATAEAMEATEGMTRQ